MAYILRFRFALNNHIDRLLGEQNRWAPPEPTGNIQLEYDRNATMPLFGIRTLVSATLFLLSFFRAPSISSDDLSHIQGSGILNQISLQLAVASDCDALGPLLPDRVFFPGNEDYDTFVSSYFFVEERLNPTCVVVPTTAEEV
jgi:hypothetical protein